MISALLLAMGLWGLWTPDLPTAQLLHRHGVPGQQVLEVDGLRISYQDTGPPQAPALILLHGFGSSLQTWNAWVPVLSRDYRVIRLDLPGFGLTGPRADRDYSEDRDLSTLRQFADRLGLRSFSVIGHSMGGKMAWSLAASEPERVKALVLMAPDGLASPAQWGTKPYEVSGVMHLIEYTLPRPLVRQFVGAAFTDPQLLTEPLAQRYHDLLRAPGVRGAILDRAHQTVYSNPLSRLQSIQAPTLLLWGGNDRMIPSSHAASYAQLLPRSQTAVLPQLGHVLQEEQPEQGLALVQAFLNAQVPNPLSVQ